MADTEIPNRFLPALRAVLWGVLPFIGILLAVERLFEGHNYQALASFIAAVLSFLVAVYWVKIIPSRLQERPGRLEYLHYKDAELGSAIRDMIWRSAWAKWYSAQHLVNSGQPIAEEELLHVASHIVMQKLIDGDLAVRGRLPGNMEYENIPQTHWRSSALHFVRDPIALWRMIIIPRGGAEIAPDGTVKASDPTAEQRTAEILNYDSLIVEGPQFEKLWPRKEPLADKKRRQLLRKARKRNLDKDEIQKLFQD